MMSVLQANPDTMCALCGAPVAAGLPGLCPRCLLKPALSWAQTTIEAEAEPDPSHEPLAAGSRMGPYVTEGLIGEGGFAEVYAAFQERPLRRRLALKILKPGMNSREIIARFEGERQALAALTHPNIVRIFDAGMTPQGRPWFAMELVEGVPLTDYCHGGMLKDRLRLFVELCRAVHHAHQKGLIHRDLKPSNILVAETEGGPTVKVIDFGISKVLERDFTGQTLMTLFGGVMGTPQYMSPEQVEARGFGVDARSDIYSLGVILYELLTGSPPLSVSRIREATQTELVRLICDAEPTPPSKQAANLPAGDYDWIALKALAKEPERRYESAAALAADVERLLKDEPILARPPTAGYRLSKFSQRHRAALLAGVLIIASLVAGTVISSIQAARARTAKLEAQEALAQATTAQERLRREKYRATIKLAESRAGGPLQHTIPELLWSTEKSLRGWEWGWLMAQCPQPNWAWNAGPGKVTGIAVSHDGSKVYTAVAPGVLTAWNGRTHRKIWERSDMGKIWDLAAHPKTDQLAVTCTTPARVLEVIDGEIGLTIFKDTEHKFKRCAWGPAGTFLFVLSDQLLAKYDRVGWSIVKSCTLNTTGASNRPLLIDRAARLAVIAPNWDGPLSSFDADSLEPVKTFESLRPSREFNGGVIDTRRDLIAQAYERYLYLGTNSGSLPPEPTYTNSSIITQIAAGPDNSIILVGEDSVKMIRAGKVDAQLLGPSRITALGMHKDGQLLAGDEKGFVRQWEGMNTPPLRVESNYEDVIGGRYLTFAPNDATLLFFRHMEMIGRPVKLAPEPTLQPWKGNVTSKTFTHNFRSHQSLPMLNPHGGEIVTARPNSLVLYRLAPDNSWQTREIPVHAHPTSAAFAADGRLMIISCEDGVWLHDVRSGDVRPAPFPSQSGTMVDLTPDGRWGMASANGRFRVWEVSSAKVCLDLPLPRSVGALHPKGEVVALSPHNQEIQIRRLPDGALLRTLRMAGRWPHLVRFTEDGSRLYAAGPENKIWWWDWQLEEELLVFDELSNVMDVTISGNGLMLADCCAGIGARIRHALPWWHDEGDPAFYKAVEKLRR